jgi:hypothetical protein
MQVLCPKYITGVFISSLTMMHIVILYKLSTILQYPYLAFKNVLPSPFCPSAGGFHVALSPSSSYSITSLSPIALFSVSTFLLGGKGTVYTFESRDLFTAAFLEREGGGVKLRKGGGRTKENVYIYIYIYI